MQLNNEIIKELNKDKKLSIDKQKYKSICEYKITNLETKKKELKPFLSNIN